MLVFEGDRTRNTLVQAGASDLLPSVGDGHSLLHYLLHSRYERAVGSCQEADDLAGYVERSVRYVNMQSAAMNLFSYLRRRRREQVHFGTYIIACLSLLRDELHANRTGAREASDKNNRFAREFEGQTLFQKAQEIISKLSLTSKCDPSEELKHGEVSYAALESGQLQAQANSWSGLSRGECV